ncbi:MAG: hypothetical protein IIU33_09770, partial [Bacteroidales bacterium]|nr:hypothetical protein [Bacteroidales bacterium]
SVPLSESSSISKKRRAMIKIEIFEDGRFKGCIKIKDKWLGIVPIDEDEIRQEVEQRLPTLRKANYSIAFA